VCNCGLKHRNATGQDVNYKCTCGIFITVPPDGEYIEPAAVQDTLVIDGTAAWIKLHRYPLSIKPTEWNPVKAAEWYLYEWLPTIPRYCTCQEEWSTLTLKHPPTFLSPGKFFRWTVDRHNDVNIRLGKETVSYCEAVRIHSCPQS